MVNQPFTEQMEVAHVRGCEIEGMLGPDGKVIEEFGIDFTFKVMLIFLKILIFCL